MLTERSNAVLLIPHLSRKLNLSSKRRYVQGARVCSLCWVMSGTQAGVHSYLEPRSRLPPAATPDLLVRP